MVNHLFLWAMASMAMLNNQRVVPTACARISTATCIDQTADLTSLTSESTLEKCGMQSAEKLASDDQKNEDVFKFNQQFVFGCAKSQKECPCPQRTTKSQWKVGIAPSETDVAWPRKLSEHPFPT